MAIDDNDTDGDDDANDAGAYNDDDADDDDDDDDEDADDDDDADDDAGKVCTVTRKKMPWEGHSGVQIITGVGQVKLKPSCYN